MATTRLFTDNAVGSLHTDYPSPTNSIVVDTPGGSHFPVPGTGQCFDIVINPPVPGESITNTEIVTVTTNTSGTFTLLTNTVNAHVLGETVELSLTTAALSNFLDKTTTTFVPSVFGRSGAVVAQAGDYTAAQVTNAGDKNSTSPQVFNGGVGSGAILPATGQAVFKGVTVTGPPTSGGPFAIGDFVTDLNGGVWNCQTAGSPGVWRGATGQQTPRGRIYMLNNHTVSGSGTQVLIPLNANGIAIGGFSNAGTGLLTLPSANSQGYPVASTGDYQVNFQVSWIPSASDSGTFTAYLIDNTSTVWAETFATVSNGNSSEAVCCTFSDILSIPAGRSLGVYGGYSMAGTRTVVGGACYLSASYLS